MWLLCCEIWRHNLCNRHLDVILLIEKKIKKIVCVLQIVYYLILKRPFDRCVLFYPWPACVISILYVYQLCESTGNVCN